MISVLVPLPILNQLAQFASGPNRIIEHGGLILGYRKTTALQVVAITKPGTWDQGSSTRFQRSARGHRETALRHWLLSGKRIDWIGEWHTHPFGSATPSMTDRSTWAQLVRHTGKPMSFMIFTPSDRLIAIQCSRFGQIRALDEVELADGFALFG